MLSPQLIVHWLIVSAPGSDDDKVERVARSFIDARRAADRQRRRDVVDRHRDRVAGRIRTILIRRRRADRVIRAAIGVRVRDARRIAGDDLRACRPN